MFTYIIRRLLLMIPTFIGTTMMVFFILAVVPGGPFERAVLQLKQAQMTSGEGGGAGGGEATGSTKLSPQVLDQLRKQYGLDKPIFVRYLIWLGVYPREVKSKTITIGKTFRENIEYVKVEGTTYEVQKWIKVEEENGNIVIFESGLGSDFKFSDDYEELPPAYEIANWYPNSDWEIKENTGEKVSLIQTAFSGVIAGDLGVSYVYDEPVTQLIKDRLHISLYFGLLGFLLSYGICIPLGIFKALKHGSAFDFLSSAIVFIGYSVPGYALGALLLVYFGGGSFWNVFPLGEFRSPQEIWNQMTFLEQVWDQIHHTFLPVLAYMVGSFATLTVLMKNSLLENLSQDYVRTAFAKGLSERRVIFYHTVRNSLIPLATGIGNLIGIFIAGSYLIEKVFNIEGIGLLSFNAIITVDFPIVLGFLVISTSIRLFGNLISDMCYAAIDPRIRFN
ncbi:MAG: ABC transporter permease subunit [Calditrichaeota bacterium]|nr:MAG: ABC transporter permease subunit [Calditrichota bacterium]